VVTESKPSNVDNLNNMRREASRPFRNKKKKYLKAKINDLETNSKNRNIGDLYRGINDFNSLTPDLNAPAQQLPAEVFKYGFLFLTLTLRKKIISLTLLHQISGNKISQCVYELINWGKNVHVFL
jgi:hypothetical protein